ncbi:FAD:protein FMN transferase [Kushneria pakistanensis]|uniref:FAD:protein FMN transferase n=1 Tax=Kushneria pakistanensis TaxID=1508770 RepID=A0ABQ3F934_9GAMM|nr:FAD:protein FMN transferase [Kushneria pakistanensis]GHC14623.1 FAD:protein FMN transferase [Kushneria pakistanensis]
MNTRALVPFASIIAGLLLAGCDRIPEIELAQGEAQGTTYHVKWWGEDAPSQDAIETDLANVLAQIDQEISTYRDDSWISRFNASRSTDWQEAPPDVIHLLQIARRVHERSEGCYDPTVAPLFALWGFQNQNFRVPSEDEINEVMAHTGLEHLEIDADQSRIRKTVPELSLDLSSMGEGHSVDRIAAMLEAHGIHDYLAELGGDMRIRGAKPDDEPWRVGIESPTPGERRAGNIVTLTDREGLSLNTSGTYRRYFDDSGHAYGHIIDPRSGTPATHDLVSATVFGTEAAVSDAWATTMLCLGREEGTRVADREGLPVYFIERHGDNDFAYSRTAALKESQQLTLE